MNTFHLWLYPLLIGCILDALIGDPYSFPHPIRLFGKCISYMDKVFNKGDYRKLKGAFVALFLLAITIVFFLLVNHFLFRVEWLYLIINSIFVYYALSGRQLIKEAKFVERFVMQNNLEGARKQLSYIVGRDTSNLSFNQIRTATLETVAENLSDGVVAPLFFYLIGGVPLMMGYKMINTMDSMIGYKNAKYKDFGFFAARVLDDVANYLPARITSMIMVLLYPSKRVIEFIRKYARAHSSPNSGYPESAMAGILDCQFGGPNVYHGEVVYKPFIGNNARDLNHSDLIKSYFILANVSLISVVMFVLLRYIIW